MVLLAQFEVVEHKPRCIARQRLDDKERRSVVGNVESPDIIEFVDHAAVVDDSAPRRLLRPKPARIVPSGFAFPRTGRSGSERQRAIEHHAKGVHDREPCAVSRRVGRRGPYPMPFAARPPSGTAGQRAPPPGSVRPPPASLASSTGFREMRRPTRFVCRSAKHHSRPGYSVAHRGNGLDRRQATTMTSKPITVATMAMVSQALPGTRRNRNVLAPRSFRIH